MPLRMQLECGALVIVVWIAALQVRHRLCRWDWALLASGSVFLVIGTIMRSIGLARPDRPYNGWYTEGSSLCVVALVFLVVEVVRASGGQASGHPREPLLAAAYRGKVLSLAVAIVTMAVTVLTPISCGVKLASPLLGNQFYLTTVLLPVAYGIMLAGWFQSSRRNARLTSAPIPLSKGRWVFLSSCAVVIAAYLPVIAGIVRVSGTGSYVLTPALPAFGGVIFCLIFQLLLAKLCYCLALWALCAGV